MTYSEWKKKLYEDSNSQIIQNLQGSNIEYNEAKRTKEKLTSDAIVSKIAGGDMTDGSCSSVAFAYAGNNNGLDVLDFRGGESRTFFSKISNIKAIAQIKGVISKIEETTNQLNNAIDMIKSIAKNKEYYLATGRHAAIIKQDDEGYKYLELQSATENGYKTLNTEALKKRFKCQKSIKRYGQVIKSTNILIDIKSLNNSDFNTILGYINTNEKSQKKGTNGSVK